jgi:phospholipid/cholesterol/gamma-HCH transport system ATP-binding protein
MLQRQFLHTPLADLASGILWPDGGEAKFRGRSWRQMLPTRTGRERGCIGRVFQGKAWVSNLNVDENILLPQLHYSSLPTAELNMEAEKLAKQFGLAGLPTSRPAATSAPDLTRAALVRAFLGRPDLLLLDCPEQSLTGQIVPPLLLAINAARGRGAAVLWLTHHSEVFNDPEVKPTARYRMAGRILQLET